MYYTRYTKVQTTSIILWTYCYTCTNILRVPMIDKKIEFNVCITYIDVQMLQCTIVLTNSCFCSDLIKALLTYQLSRPHHSKLITLLLRNPPHLVIRHNSSILYRFVGACKVYPILTLSSQHALSLELCKVSDTLFIVILKIEKCKNYQ